ncbi:MAG: hypothetical protein ABI134_05945, partial [Byssovorax sp.]
DRSNEIMPEHLQEIEGLPVAEPVSATSPCTKFTLPLGQEILEPGWQIAGVPPRAKLPEEV